jgi:rhodanese-related sulfurtransferase/DNA-binding transcriptional ArsR family regulator
LNVDPIDRRKRRFKDGCYGELAKIGAALASPKRLELLDLLSQSERTVQALAKETAMGVANASQHLRILESARLVEVRKEGRFAIYRLADPLVADFLRAYRLLGEDRLAEIQRLRERFFGGGQDICGVDREGLLRRVQAGEAVVIDVRPSNEYDTAHIAGAMSIPLQLLEERLGELPRDKNIVAYCRGPYCVLASEAVQLLGARGFQAFRLEDSVHDWQAHGLPIETGKQPFASPTGESA